MCCICYAVSLCSVLYGKPEDVCVIFVMLLQHIHMLCSVLYGKPEDMCVIFVMLLLCSV